MVKVPRFAFEKFPGADPTLTTTMKSVGEAMAIGRCFTEALQKALRSLEKRDAASTGTGARRPAPSSRPCWRRCARPTESRLVQVQQALRGGAGIEAAARGHRHRPLVPRPGDADRGGRAAGRHRRAADRRRAARGQAARLLRPADRRAARHARGRRPRPAARPGHAPGLQDGGHLRGRVRGQHALPLLQLRRGGRGRALGPAQGDHPGLGAEPDRAGHRVRLLLRARLVRAARGRRTRP